MAGNPLSEWLQTLHHTCRLARLKCLVYASIIAVIPGCSGNQQTAGEIHFSQKTVCLWSNGQSVPLRVEVASSGRHRAQGLMERTTLAPGTGMLFVFDKVQPAERSFWMYRTKIPLDIVFLNKQGVILSINQMEPCREPRKKQCPLYPAGKPFWFALETNRGFMERQGVKPGDRIDLDPVDPCGLSNPSKPTPRPDNRAQSL